MILIVFVSFSSGLWLWYTLHMINIKLYDIKDMAMYIQILESCEDFEPLGGVKELWWWFSLALQGPEKYQ